MSQFSELGKWKVGIRPLLHTNSFVAESESNNGSLVSVISELPMLTSWSINNLAFLWLIDIDIHVLHSPCYSLTTVKSLELKSRHRKAYRLFLVRIHSPRWSGKLSILRFWLRTTLYNPPFSGPAWIFHLCWAEKVCCSSELYTFLIVQCSTTTVSWLDSRSLSSEDAAGITSSSNLRFLFLFVEAMS